MASVLVHTADENVTLSARAARLLLEKGDGDAALLYLALLRHHGTVPPRSLAGELRWERSRIEAAEETLRALGLIAPAEAWALNSSSAILAAVRTAASVRPTLALPSTSAILSPT